MMSGLDTNVSTDCVLYSIDSFNDTFSPRLNNFFTIHQNIRSFNCNIDKFLLYILNLKTSPDVIILTETFFGPNNFHEISGYVGYHVYRTDKIGGGVSIFVKDEYMSTQSLQLCFVNDDAEICSVNVKISPNYTIHIVGYYRPPSASVEAFCNILDDQILTSFNTRDNILLTGDANINLFNNINTGVVRYTDILYGYGFIPYITLPTRVTDLSCTLIDHIWAKTHINMKSGLFDSDISDHRAVFLCMKVPRNDHSTICKKFRNHSAGNLQNLREKLKLFLENFGIYDGLSVDHRVSIFITKLYNLYNECCPINSKVYPSYKLTKPWLDDDLIKLSKIKQNLYSDFKRGDVSRSVYAYFKNEYTSILRRCKINYYRDKFEVCMGDIRKTWDNIKGIIGCKNKREITEILHEGSVL